MTVKVAPRKSPFEKHKRRDGGACRAVVGLMEQGKADSGIASALKMIEELEQNG